MTDALGNVTSYSYGNAETGGTYDEMRSASTWVRYHYNEDGELINITAQSSLTSKQSKYVFTYNDLGLITGVYVQNVSNPIVTYTYGGDFTLSEMTYGNGYRVSYGYDSLDRLELVWYNGVKTYEYSYYLDGNLYRSANLVTGETVEYIYENGVLSHEFRFDTALNKALYNKFDAEGASIGTALHFIGTGGAWVENSWGESYDDEGTLTGITTSFGATLSFAYDDFERASVYTLGLGYEKQFAYKSATENLSGSLVSSVVYKKSSGTTSASYSYTYDAKGNITEIYKGSTLIASYAYDSLGQMIREDCVDADKTYLYTYDGLGNILSKSEYPFAPACYEPAYGSAVYSYGYTSSAWGDLLTEYNGTAITYDAIGNPLSYYNGTAYAFTWQGRTLSTATVGGVTSSYVYDSDGLRTQKTVGTTVYDYYWYNSKLSAMTITNGSNITTMMFAYDPEGMPFAMSYNGTVYYYCTDVQGNVLGIIDEYGLCAYYRYDAWGNILTIDAASTAPYNAIMANPLRYRGYIYDSDTELYYLQSRYYDPVTGRFLNADDVMFLGATGTVLSTNLFSYCENNATNKIDDGGTFGTPIQWAMAVIGGIAGWYFGDYVARKLGYKSGWKYWAIRSGVIIGGAVIGWFAGSAITIIAKNFLLANPSILAKIPSGVLSFLGLSNLIQYVNFASTSKLMEHFLTHGSEWGNKFKTAQQYLRAANDLLHRTGSKIYQFTSSQGWTFKYDAVRNELLIISPHGTISSFFRPIDGILYWIEQVNKYGK